MGFLGSRPWVSSPVLAMVGTRLRLSHSQRSPLYLILACCLRMCCRVTLGTMRIPRLGRAHSAWFHGLRNVKQTPKFSWQWFSVLLYDGGALSRALESYNSKCCAVALKMGLQDASQGLIRTELGNRDSGKGCSLFVPRTIRDGVHAYPSMRPKDWFNSPNSHRF